MGQQDFKLPVHRSSNRLLGGSIMKNLFTQRCFECSIEGKKKEIKNIETKPNKVIKNEIFFSQRKL
ncbi:MAG: hypothetical protein WBA54_15710 [Acidaminobacteraceae bacterium]